MDIATYFTTRALCSTRVPIATWAVGRSKALSESHLSRVCKLWQALYRVSLHLKFLIRYLFIVSYLTLPKFSGKRIVYYVYLFSFFNQRTKFFDVDSISIIVFRAFSGLLHAFSGLLKVSKLNLKKSTSVV